MGSTSSSQTMTTTASSTTAPVTDNFTEFSVWTEAFWNSSSSSPTLSLLLSADISLANDTDVSVVTDLIIPGEDDASCVEWEAAQHNLFQTANLFFAAAFIVPRSFKQSLLLLRAFLCVGFSLSALWAGIHVCAPDAFAWSVGLVFLNAVHTAILTCRFLPPPLSVELTELYLKLFKPLRVSKKHFKELTREGQLLHLEPGETYAVEEVTPADERLSVLLKGKLRVTCDNTHLHYIHSHQFIDSPEWEANHDRSEDVFQVTITAEQECLYMCWSRLKLKRVLRHRPGLQVVLSNIIGKDITQKLYSLNEHLGAMANIEMAAKALGRSPDHWRSMNRSLSMDAVHTGTRGHVRSVSWRAQQQRRTSATYSDRSTSPSRFTQHQCWVPVVANHFPVTSPFGNYPHTVITTASTTVVTAATTAAVQQFTASPPVALVPVIVPVLAPPPAQTHTRSRSIRRPGGREVKFETPV
ncbi:blood vessel epicardial substance-A-like isoform X2 [Zootermopsis nevadensis]|nr:blood vessel epicardial substance-A-like isoform X2 [Zootermopsis nevadensis]